jgi:hypothetical protein
VALHPNTLVGGLDNEPRKSYGNHALMGGAEVLARRLDEARDPLFFEHILPGIIGIAPQLHLTEKQVIIVGHHQVDVVALAPRPAMFLQVIAAFPQVMGDDTFAPKATLKVVP